jgi:DMSO reductase family type II enzyme heme b subunit
MRTNRLLISIAVAAALSGCRKEPVRTAEVVAVGVAQLPTDPTDAAWDGAPEHFAKLVPQDQVEPRLLKPSTSEVKVRALASGSDIAFRLEWADANPSDTPGPAKMVDAVAIQIPQGIAKEPPAPQMGEGGKPVQVTYWRADWQASVNGRADTIRDLYPNAAVDHYPFQAKPLENDAAAQKEAALRYAPARALGNLRSGPRSTPVEDLVATGPGTLRPGPSLGSKGKGMHKTGVWSVVISRRLPEGLTPGQRTHVALAVWQGSEHESGSRKMRSGWIPFLVRGRS